MPDSFAPVTGVKCVDLCGGGEQNSSLRLTNSVNVADATRISQGSTEGELLLCKVFVGLSREVKSKQEYVIILCCVCV